MDVNWKSAFDANALILLQNIELNTHVTYITYVTVFTFNDLFDKWLKHEFEAGIYHIINV